MGLELLFLLLPLAALSGWWIGRKSRDKQSTGDCSLSSDYFKGLNYLLNEQPDKAMDIFIRMLEVDSDTFETHIALGNLFRRKGEVDRAIRIHQNLIARPSLLKQERHQALYELGVDYQRAGFLDRAENLFDELSEVAEYNQPALVQLLDIYQQEKEWDNAVSAARRLSSLRGKSLQAEIAHFYCELAQLAINRGDLLEARKFVKRALSEDRRCVRATLMEGRFELDKGASKAAIRILKRVEQQDPDFLPEIISPLQQAYQQLGRPFELIHYLREILRKYGGISILLTLADLIRLQQSEQDAAAFMTQYLQTHPSIRGMSYLLEMKLSQDSSTGSTDLRSLHGMMNAFLESKPIYQCRHCGFSGKVLHWHCPSCKQWNSTKPIHGIEGE